MNPQLTPLQQLHVRIKDEFDAAEAALSPRAFLALCEITRTETEIRLARLAVREAESILASEGG